jgi:hypothetical protein
MGDGYTGAGLCLMTAFRINKGELSGSTTRNSVSH